MSDPFIGQITLFAGNFAPRGWAFCEGQLLAINQYQALFSILGTIYGGDGRTTFGLPDLRGRAPIGVGNGPGLTNVRQGERGGLETVTLGSSELPAHTHQLTATTETADTQDPSNARLPTGRSRIYATEEGTVVPMATRTTSTGNGQPFSVRPPYLGMRYIMALVGTYPSRS